MLRKLKYFLDIIYMIAKIRKTKPIEMFGGQYEDATQGVA